MPAFWDTGILTVDCTIRTCLIARISDGEYGLLEIPNFH